MQKISDIKHVIVQAGGRGKRMGRLTDNRPKCLIPVEGKPLLFHLLEHFPNAQFTVVADYKHNILANYLITMDQENRFHLVQGDGTGDVAGLRTALEQIPNEPFALIWSDLLLGNIPDIDISAENHIGLTRDFECRWSFTHHKAEEIASSESGILGFFTFTSKSEIPSLPRNGQFLDSMRDVEMHPVFLDGTVEIGNPEKYAEFAQPVGRPYNSLVFEEDTVIKRCSDDIHAYKIPMETSWYEKVSTLGFSNIPNILSNTPLTMERIQGKHPFEIQPNKQVLENIMDTIETLHDLGEVDFDQSSCQHAHIDIPIEALERVASLLPQDREYKVNGRQCINPFVDRSVFNHCKTMFTKRPFRVIHGECTFSNTIIRDDSKVYLIDPSPYYGQTEQPYGNPLYDWSKIYYSIIGCYDMFNQKNFKLDIRGKDIELEIAASGWEPHIPIFAERFTKETLDEIKMIHALEWFLLAAHCTDDTDAILTAFFNGMLLLEQSTNPDVIRSIRK